MSEPEPLSNLRGRIDEVDAALVRTLNERIRLAVEVGRAKRREGKPVYDPAREREVLARVAALNEGPLAEKNLHQIYREIISAAVRLQQPLRVAYLGPEGTFTQQAALRNFGSSVDLVDCRTIPDVFAGVLRGEADYGVVPVENSIYGSVFMTLDQLADSDLRIHAEVFLKIEHCLLTREKPEAIQRVYSKDQAFGQCRNWLLAHLPVAEWVEVDSTAAAARRAAAEDGAAAIGSEAAALAAGIPVLSRGIQDSSDNLTRFLVVGPSDHRPPPTGSDKTSLVLSFRDEAGALRSMLEPFERRGISLTRIESRPSRRQAWEYVFFIDFGGHRDEEEVAGLLDDLRRAGGRVNVLGSYPDAGSVKL